MQNSAVIGHGHPTKRETRANGESLQELTPLIYTPVVGEACQRWSEIYQQPEGTYYDSNRKHEDEPAPLTPF